MAAASPDDVEALIARGDYHAAARELARGGEFEKAQALLEKVWDFAAAAAIARVRGDRAATLRLLLDGRDVAGAGELLAEIAGRGDGAELRAAAEVCDRRRMWREAAQLLARAGEPAEARERYVRAGLLLEAGAIDERLGKLREAGMAYEQVVAGAPDEDEADGARAGLALGRVLGLLGRHEEAVRQLQRALRRPLARQGVDEAERLLVVSLAALGMRDGARKVLERLRARDPALGPLDSFLAAAARERGGGDLLAGRYRVIRLLGAGSMGRVYLAQDRVLDEDVAVKVVPPPIEPRARDSYRRFLRETRAVASIAHPNVVSAREVMEAEGLLVMEYLPGGTLEARAEPAGTRIGVGPSAAARKLLLEVIAGLQAAHAHGIIHRDVKPANIFFSATGEAKLGDFGAAHLQDLGATRTAGFVGTLGYMAPEQITAAPLTFACDVYALGVTTFQLLTGRLPFEGPDFVGQHLGEVPPAPSSRALRAAPEWPAWDRLVLRMLAKDPAQRHGSLDELRREIEALPVPSSMVEAVGEAAGEAAAAGAPPEPPLPSAPSGEVARYRIEAPAGATAISTLHHGIDERLGRPVIVERFAAGALEGEAGAARLARLRLLARSGGPHLQRVLRLDPRAGLAVYEAVPGARVNDLPEPLAREAAARLALEVLLALAGPHQAGVGHGALADALVMGATGATVTIAGMADLVGTPAEDLEALWRLLARRSALPDLPDPGAAAAELVAWARAAAAG